MSLAIKVTKDMGSFRLDCALEAPTGITALFGRSGAGKTTLAKCVAGLIRPDSGAITLEGRALFDQAARIWVPPHKRRIGYVFQDARLFPHQTVAQNLRYGQRFLPRGLTAPDMSPVIDMLGLGPLLGRYPYDLSGGETQRVAIGRALLMAPKVLILDEPLAALDERRKTEILPYLERLRDHADIPMLYVSHSVAEVARLATTLVTLENGGVTGVGPTSEMLSNPEIAPIIGIRRMGAVLNAEVLEHTEDGLSLLRTKGGNLFLPRIQNPVGTQARIRILGQDVILATEMPRGLSAMNVLEGQITSIRFGDGPGALVQLSMNGDPLLARITRRSVAQMGLEVGQPCYAIVKTLSVAQADVGG
jgi:molybdate transport system ATP-binding protein